MDQPTLPGRGWQDPGSCETHQRPPRPCPSWRVKACSDKMQAPLADIIIFSLSPGTFPRVLKETEVRHTWRSHLWILPSQSSTAQFQIFHFWVRWLKEWSLEASRRQTTCVHFISLDPMYVHTFYLNKMNGGGGWGDTLMFCRFLL